MRLLDLSGAYSAGNRNRFLAAGLLLIAAIGLLDWIIQPDPWLGFLYLFPMMLVAPVLSRVQIATLAALCTFLREVFSPSPWKAEVAPGMMLTPFLNVTLLFGELALVLTAFLGVGLFIAEVTWKLQILTEHVRRVEEEVKLRKEAEEQLRVLVETSPAAILTADAHGRILLANAAAHELLEFEQEPLKGQPIAPYLPVLAAALKDDGAVQSFRTILECTGRRRNGEVFFAHVCFSTYHTVSGSRLAAIVWDASDLLRDREGFGLDSLITTSRMLVRAILHEVRNLSAAAAVSHANLARYPGLAENEDFQALGALMNGLETMASSELRVPPDREHTTADPYKVLDELRIVLKPLFERSGTETHWLIAQGLPRVRGDHRSLLQVFVNLAQNSDRAMRESEEKRLTITASVESEWVMIRVQDTGPGVAVPERLFQPFQQGADATGLGLYISRAIVRSFAGNLRHEPQPAGSCFTVQLARAQGRQEDNNLYEPPDKKDPHPSPG